MKKFLLVFVALFAAFIGLQAKTGLVVIAHGHVLESWRKPVLALEQTLKTRLAERGINDFDYVRIAMMEYTEPSVASVINDCEKQGMTRYSHCRSSSPRQVTRKMTFPISWD